MDELIRRIPEIVAIIIIVYAFLQAQARRDALFVMAIKDNSLILAELTKILIEHDSAMRVTAGNLEKGIRRKVK
jgi:hypothetical protein